MLFCRFFIELFGNECWLLLNSLFVIKLLTVFFIYVYSINFKLSVNLMHLADKAFKEGELFDEFHISTIEFLKFSLRLFFFKCHITLSLLVSQSQFEACIEKPINA